MNQSIEVIKIEIAKMSPQDGDTIVLKLHNFKNMPVSRMNAMTDTFKKTYPNLKFLIIDAQDEIEIMKRETI
jgi:hypothetical protein